MAITSDVAVTRPCPVVTRKREPTLSIPVDRAGHAPGDAAALAFRLQHADHLQGGVVAEELAQLLLVIGDAVAFDQAHEVRGRVARERRPAEFRIARKIVGRTCVAVREVAAAAAGDADLLADDGVVLDQENAAAALAGLRRAHHARGAGADDDYIVFRNQMPRRRASVDGARSRRDERSASITEELLHFVEPALGTRIVLAGVFRVDRFELAQELLLAAP